MNPTLTVWLQLIGLLAVEVAVIVGIAAQLQRMTTAAIWRRTIWHACILSLLLLVVFEFTGAARGPFGGMGKKPAPATPIPANGSDAERRVSTPQAGPLLQMHAEFQQTTTDHATRATQPRPIAEKSSKTVALSEARSVLWFGLLWMAGTAIVVGRTFVSRVVLEVFRWRRKGIENVGLHKSVQSLALRLGIRGRVRLMESARIYAPVAFGVFRPTIGLPPYPQFGLKYDSVQQEAMLAHELAHLAGKDPAWYLLADILAAALWWHPLVWWSRRQLHAQSEQVVDEASLLVADGPGVLAECLVELGARLAQTRSFIPLGVVGNGYRSGLGRRVERLVKLEGTDWRPPSRIRCGLAETLGPVALVTAAILCTAWAVPQELTKGENMQTMKQTWKKSLAAFALLTAFGSSGNTVLADTTDPQPAIKTEAATEATANIKPSGGSFGSSSTASVSPHQFGTRLESRLTRLSSAPKISKERQAIQEKLSRITVAGVQYDGLPLGEVINDLVKVSTDRDTDKQGINFVLDREQPALANAQITLDPTTGLPMAAESIDLGSVTVKISPPLKNVRLIDVLEVITKTADRPIKFSIEDYGVLFSLDTPKSSGGSSAKPLPEQRIKSLPEHMEAMTFMVMNADTFIAGMERAFGIKPQTNKPADIKNSLKELFQGLGIDMEAPNRAVFYNDVNKILMVRGTSQDMAVMKAAIETLGGIPSPFSQSAASGAGGSGR